MFRRTKRNPLSTIQNFRIYYGPVDDAALTTLEKINLVILEPQHIDSDKVQALQSAGTLVAGYLSVMETPLWNVERKDQLQREDYYQQGGQVVHFPAWDSYLMDLRQPHYQELLLQEIERRIVSRKMDGLFLDTVGDIEEHVPPGAERNEMVEAYLNLLQKIRRLAPSLFLIQNRGFDLLPTATPHLQGVLWEDWRGDLVDDEWVKIRLNRVEALQRSGVQVLTVNTRSEDIHKQESNRHGFVHLSLPQGYDVL